MKDRLRALGRPLAILAVVLIAALGAVSWQQSAARLPWQTSSPAAAVAAPRSPEPVEAQRESE